MVELFVGLTHPSDAQHLDHVFISVNPLRHRKSDFKVGNWIMDSGAFTELSTHGGYRHPVGEYAAQIRRWKRCGNMLAAVAQDLMCEPWILERTGLTIEDHQRLTIERYDDLLQAGTGVYTLPVLQGYAPEDYARHVHMYGDRLGPQAWTGVGSICKRNKSPRAVEAVLLAIYDVRPDLRLHGFGIKATSLRSGIVDRLLATADSMAWSYAARKQGRNRHDWREGKLWRDRILRRPLQLPLFV